MKIIIKNRKAKRRREATNLLFKSRKPKANDEKKDYDFSSTLPTVVVVSEGDEEDLKNCGKSRSSSSSLRT